MLPLAQIKALTPSFNEYCTAVNKYNLHPELGPIVEQLPADINQFENLLIYGPPGCGKYSQSLHCIQKYSLTNLRYEKKINMSIVCKSKTVPFILKVSDIHFEVNMEFIGCHPKTLWDEIYHQIINIAIGRPSLSIVICRDFQSTSPELLAIFYSYMRKYQKSPNSSKKIIKFIFITSALSFIPNAIVNSCKLIRVCRPSVAQYTAIGPEPGELNKITNIIKLSEILPQRFICNNIIDKITATGKINHLEFRDAVYEIFTCCLNIFDCLSYIIFSMIENGTITRITMPLVFQNALTFIKYYEHNYRPIFHLERFLCQQMLIVQNNS